MRAHYGFAGKTIVIHTNSAEIVEAARASFGAEVATGRADFTFNLQVRDGASGAPLISPVFRGRDFLVFAQFGPGTSVLFNLRTRVAQGIVSPAVARDKDYWRNTLFPVAVGTIAPVLGIVPLHSACVVVDGEALLIAGESGAGKSTLSLAMARAGLPFVSDDWTFLSSHASQLKVSSLPVAAKVLPDAVRFFPELRPRSPRMSQNGESAIEFDPETALGVARAGSAVPRRVVLLNRVPGAGPRLAAAPIEHLLAMFASALDTIPQCLGQERRRQLDLVRGLERCECWHLECNGSPEEIGAILLQVCRGELRANAPSPTLPQREVPLQEPDHMRRAAPAPLVFDAAVGGRVLRVDTNDPGLQRNFPALTAGCDAEPYRCTVLVEPPRVGLDRCNQQWQADGVAGIDLGRDGVIVVDHPARRIFAAVSTEFAQSAAFLELLWDQLERSSASNEAGLPANLGASVAPRETQAPAVE